MRVFTEQITPTATITGYVHDDNPATIGEATRAGVLIFPGGGYRFCSPREAEPVAVAYLAEGFTFTYWIGQDFASSNVTIS